MSEIAPEVRAVQLLDRARDVAEQILAANADR